MQQLQSDTTSKALPSLPVLKQLAESTRESHWLCRDLKVIPKSFYHTRLYNFMIKYFPMMHAFMQIDLQESQKALKQIQAKEISLKNTEAVVLFNAAVRKFNTIAPAFPVKEVVPEILQKLINECIRPPLKHFAEDLLCNVPPCTKEAVDNYPRFEKYNRDLNFGWIQDFERCGGKVILLPEMKPTERYPAMLGIKNQELIPVCHMGLVRSPTLGLIATHVKRGIGYSEGQENVRPSNGVKGGYDPFKYSEIPDSPTIDERCFSENFQKAFGVDRPIRFGREFYEKVIAKQTRYEFFFGNSYDQKAWEDDFTKHYYEPKGPVPKVFLTFADTGISILHRLMRTNLPKDDHQKYIVTPNTLNNVTVVMLPAQDNISNFAISDEMFKVLMGMYDQEQTMTSHNLRKFSDLTNEDRRQVLYTIKGDLSPDKEFHHNLRCYYEIIRKFVVEKTGLRYSIDDFIMQESFRAAYWKWSGLFQGVKD